MTQLDCEFCGADLGYGILPCRNCGGQRLDGHKVRQYALSVKMERLERHLEKRPCDTNAIKELSTLYREFEAVTRLLERRATQ
jgi:hypothetical protein